jgi:hypothetical protein
MDKQNSQILNSEYYKKRNMNPNKNPGMKSEVSS